MIYDHWYITHMWVLFGCDVRKSDNNVVRMPYGATCVLYMPTVRMRLKLNTAPQLLYIIFPIYFLFLFHPASYSTALNCMCVVAIPFQSANCSKSTQQPLHRIERVCSSCITEWWNASAMLYTEHNTHTVGTVRGGQKTLFGYQKKTWNGKTNRTQIIFSHSLLLWALCALCVTECIICYAELIFTISFDGL